jgi:hypothetical protein
MDQHVEPFSSLLIMIVGRSTDGRPASSSIADAEEIEVGELIAND